MQLQVFVPLTRNVQVSVVLETAADLSAFVPAAVAPGPQIGTQPERATVIVQVVAAELVQDWIAR